MAEAEKCPKQEAEMVKNVKRLLKTTKKKKSVLSTGTQF